MKFFYHLSNFSDANTFQVVFIFKKIKSTFQTPEKNIQRLCSDDKPPGWLRPRLQSRKRFAISISVSTTSRALRRLRTWPSAWSSISVSTTSRALRRLRTWPSPGIQMWRMREGVYYKLSCETARKELPVDPEGWHYRPSTGPISTKDRAKVLPYLWIWICTAGIVVTLFGVFFTLVNVWLYDLLCRLWSWSA